MLLEGKVAWITGASRGIGQACAIAFASEGASVIISSRNSEHLQSTAEQIRNQTGSDPLLLPYDVTDKDKIKEAASIVLKTYKRLDVLVNNAGIMQSARLGMITQDMIKETFESNTYSAINHMQYASRIMARHHIGSIINVSSILGRFGGESEVVYSGSKAALIGSSLSAAKELAPLNIRVNIVAPGFIDTDLIQNLSPARKQEILSMIKMGRIGRPEEVANVMVFLASDAASYITGQIIGVDGGMLI
ncbi:SDR family NAD(P)-dependent oxidoreductase [Brevibacillus ginsengisoli]|uniref:SDR family NAD(P)-dependent oxidoreductase n=1 Tax=Brevibacillus ginsengisoli TaxID=363854 RepID=UPI003CEDB433